MKKSSYKPFMVQHQAAATLNQANPVSGTQYTLLATTRNVRVIRVAAVVTWTLQPSPLEIHITIDGQTLTFAVTNPASGTYYEAVFYAEQLLLLVGVSQRDKAFLIEGKSIAITCETTGGTVQNLSGICRYAVMS